jgi:hypothetical protein
LSSLFRTQARGVLAGYIDSCLLRRAFLPCGEAGFVIGLIDIEEADPGEAHFVDGALAAADPVFGVEGVGVVVGVVVPGGEVDDGAGGEDGRDFIGVGISHAPAELIVTYAT